MLIAIILKGNIKLKTIDFKYLLKETCVGVNTGSTSGPKQDDPGPLIRKLEDFRGSISSTHFKSWSTLCVSEVGSKRQQLHGEGERSVVTLGKWQRGHATLFSSSRSYFTFWCPSLHNSGAQILTGQRKNGFSRDQAENSPFTIIPGRRPFHLGSRPPWRKRSLPGRAGNPARLQSLKNFIKFKTTGSDGR